MRNADNKSSVQHLLNLESLDTGKLTLFSTGDIGDASLSGRYNKPLVGCHAVIHAASPLSPKLKPGVEFDGERDMLRPGMAGTQEMLESIDKCSTIQCLVLTSSMSAAAPQPEPKIKDESHWSDDNAQLARGNYYGCLKTSQEKLCHEWVKGKKNKNIRFAAINPTMVLGPPVEPGCNMSTMNSLVRWLTGGRPTAPNDSMSFIHVRDCAAQHVAAMENKSASGRYFSLVESWHWNDLLTELKELYPSLPLDEHFKYEGDDVIIPTQFDNTRMNSLGVKVHRMNEILEESVKYLQDVGALK